jgi:hypothetical protein
MGAPMLRARAQVLCRSQRRGNLNKSCRIYGFCRVGAITVTMQARGASARPVFGNSAGKCARQSAAGNPTKVVLHICGAG